MRPHLPPVMLGRAFAHASTQKLPKVDQGPYQPRAGGWSVINIFNLFLFRGSGGPTRSSQVSGLSGFHLCIIATLSWRVPNHDR